MTSLTPLQIATRRHAAADALISGSYVRMNGHFQGCSIGCLAHDLEPNWNNYDIAEYGHARVAEHYDYPEWLIYFQDAIFEGLPDEDRAGWHVAIADTIAKRGRDWQIVMHAVHAAILRVALRTAGSAAGVVQAVIDLHEAVIRDESQDKAAWKAAESAAWNAAKSTARSARNAWNAANAAVESTTWSAARSAAVGTTWNAAVSAAWNAAESAAWSVAENAARGAAYQEIAAAILEEIRQQ